MQIFLGSSSHKLFWKILCLLSVLVYVVLAARDYVAYRLAFSEQPHAIEQAIALDPSKAGYRNRLGNFMFSEERPDLAISQYKSAVTLNPHIAAYWLHLASAYAATGAGEQQELALERAVEVDPNTPEVCWEAATAFLFRGDLRKGLAIFRHLLQTDPQHVEPALQICWHATSYDIDMMSDVLPTTPTVLLEFLKLLVGERNTGAAETIWSRLLALQQPFDPHLATPYLEYLIAQHDIDHAQAAWNDLARIDPSFRPYRTSAANLVVNGGFEERLLNMGFDWRYEDHPHVTVALDGGRFHGGRRSLSITFDGEAVVDSGLSQLIVVDPNTRYDFSAHVRTDINGSPPPKPAYR